MHKKIIFILLLFLMIISTACNRQTTTTTETNNKQTQTNQTSNDYPVSSAKVVADKVQIYLFHATQRCSTCNAIGKLTEETLNERFQEELESAQIEFKEINIDLPENKELAKKFQASGSALFLNSIYNGQDHITQDVKVWQLTRNSDTFKNHLQDKINILLGK